MNSTDAIPTQYRRDTDGEFRSISTAWGANRLEGRRTGGRRRKALVTRPRAVYLTGMDWTDATAPDAADIEAMALAAIESLPEQFRAHARTVALRVEEFADREILADLGIEDPFELTGLYDGIPLTEKSVADQPSQPDAIWLFRRAILDEWVDRGDVSLADLVAHVMVHELAHHFGWSDDDIATIDEWWA